MTARNGSQQLSGPGFGLGHGGSQTSAPRIGFSTDSSPPIASVIDSDPGIGFVAGFEPDPSGRVYPILDNHANTGCPAEDTEQLDRG